MRQQSTDPDLELRDRCSIDWGRYGCRLPGWVSNVQSLGQFLPLLEKETELVLGELDSRHLREKNSLFRRLCSSRNARGKMEEEKKC
ncbi:hypothetical protein RRG08_010980 [Elysia crispata]|uniref:Uncharacterized protein n=1 Tax=Elysia crispata TaxID=231223 RepID=A0AAE0XVI7_9GAST|nr:hypothetical protein RRG08_010980 [Elysia crispata]